MLLRINTATLFRYTGGILQDAWEDGAASSARETALTRQAAERLVQNQKYSGQYAPHILFLQMLGQRSGEISSFITSIPGAAL